MWVLILVILCLILLVIIAAAFVIGIKSLVEYKKTKDKKFWCEGFVCWW
ncbi:MAG: hypothetical protein FWH20_03915 [Oscillospiraceae bacterium]|nr:hypothetical protein [Oscillospiraceae bacterium]